MVAQGEESKAGIDGNTVGAAAAQAIGNTILIE